MYNVAGKEDGKASQLQQLEKYFPLPTNYVEKKNKLSQLKSKNNVVFVPLMFSSVIVAA